MTMFVLITFWCLQHSNDRVEFWLGLEFKATRFPWYVLLYTFLLKWRVLEGLGIFIAMFFYHFKYVKPKTFFGINLLGTPNILCWLFPDNPDGVVSGPQYLWGHGLKIDDWSAELVHRRRYMFQTATFRAFPQWNYICKFGERNPNWNEIHPTHPLISQIFKPFISQSNALNFLLIFRSHFRSVQFWWLSTENFIE